MSSDPSGEFPKELSGAVSDFHTSLKALESGAVDPLTSGSGRSRTELLEPLEPLDKAKVDLVSAFAINSLAWIWLKTQGQDPKESEVIKFN